MVESATFKFLRGPGKVSRSEEGQRFLDEAGNRFIVLEQIARWLSRERAQFLDTADPWLLGCNALEELRAGQVLVSQESYLEVTGVGRLASKESFSRYTRDCILVWPDATAPLSILFDSTARRSWVANALVQLLKNQKPVLNKALLDNYRNVTKPRRKDEKACVLAAAVESLSFAEVVMKATLMADVGWSDVLAEYEERMIKPDNG